MQTIIWAFGSTLVFMLVLFFLPLGFSLKGKVYMVLAGLILALGGLAAASSFPIWTTILLLTVLSFLGAYFMNSRLGTVLFNEQVLNEDDEVIDLPFSNNQIGTTTVELDMLDLSQIEVAPHPNSLVKVEEKLEIEDSLPVRPSLLLKKENVIEASEEDISFLQMRDETIEIVEEPNETEGIEVGYLSDIESLLSEESEEVAESDKSGWLEELEPILSEIKTEKNDLEELDNFELELVFAEREVAADLDDSKETSTLKKFELQK